MKTWQTDLNHYAIDRCKAALSDALSKRIVRIYVAANAIASTAYVSICVFCWNAETLSKNWLRCAPHRQELARTARALLRRGAPQLYQRTTTTHRRTYIDAQSPSVWLKWCSYARAPFNIRARARAHWQLRIYVFGRASQTASQTTANKIHFHKLYTFIGLIIWMRVYATLWSY